MKTSGQTISALLVTRHAGLLAVLVERGLAVVQDLNKLKEIGFLS